METQPALALLQRQLEDEVVESVLEAALWSEALYTIVLGAPCSVRFFWSGLPQFVDRILMLSGVTNEGAPRDLSKQQVVLDSVLAWVAALLRKRALYPPGTRRLPLPSVLNSDAQPFVIRSNFSASRTLSWNRNCEKRLESCRARCRSTVVALLGLFKSKKSPLLCAMPKDVFMIVARTVWSTRRWWMDVSLDCMNLVALHEQGIDVAFPQIACALVREVACEFQDWLGFKWSNAPAPGPPFQCVLDLLASWLRSERSSLGLPRIDMWCPHDIVLLPMDEDNPLLCICRESAQFESHRLPQDHVLVGTPTAQGDIAPLGWLHKKGAEFSSWMLLWIELQLRTLSVCWRRSIPNNCLGCFWSGRNHHRATICALQWTNLA
jgi:hypothetical protein